jgi:shikimate kinase
MKIYIIGFMGSGKSSFGKELAEKLGYEFLDLDMEIEKKEGKTISEIFSAKGEDHFRKLEHEALLVTDNKDNTVIATGGGTPCFFDQVQWMNNHGLTIYIKLFEGELKSRLEPEMETRPLLKDIDKDNLDTFIYNTLRARAYYYHQATIVINSMVTAGDMATILQENYLKG